MMLSYVCLSVCLTSVYHVHQAPPKLKTERPGKTKIDTQVAHVTRDSDTIFKVKCLRCGLQAPSAWRREVLRCPQREESGGGIL